ncbi:MAG: phosphoglycerate kinase [Candidatus Omnitrophica bacterium]|nr:phosphoglycerate kinase [Candidatus Omnitrophota bacterium]
MWIIPEKAIVYENGDTVFVSESHLKVMLEEDYLALEYNSLNSENGTDQINKNDVEQPDDVSSSIIREIIIPELEKEVNTGKNFANLRQIFNSVILATWFKRNLKESLLGKVYMDQNKVEGVNTEDRQVNEKIYQQYLEAFKVGVYDFIKEDYDTTTQEVIPRKYFSGGALLALKNAYRKRDTSEGVAVSEDSIVAGVQLVAAPHSYANRAVRETGELPDVSNLDDYRNNLPQEVMDGVRRFLRSEKGLEVDEKFMRNIPIISRPGYLSKYGEFGHVGLGEMYGEIVIYLDSESFENITRLAHEIAEAFNFESGRRDLYVSSEFITQLREFVGEYATELESIGRNGQDAIQKFEAHLKNTPGKSFEPWMMRWWIWATSEGKEFADRSHDLSPSLAEEYEIAAQAGKLPTGLRFTPTQLDQVDRNVAAGNKSRQFLTLDDVKIRDKRVLIRLDINAPVSDGKIKPTERITASSETIREAAESGAKVAIIAHQGRPGDDDYMESLDQHAQLLSEKIGRPVRAINDLYGEEAQEAIRSLQSGEVIILGNVRPKEKDPEFVANLEPLFDFFIFDGFSVAHRDTNSVTGFKNIPNVAGRLMERELDGNQRFLTALEHPYVELLGGAKISDHVDALDYGLEQGLIDRVLTGGMLGQLLLLIDGYQLGEPTMKVLREQDVDESRPEGLLSLIPRIRDIYERHRDKFESPSDLAYEDADGERQEIAITDLGEDGAPFVIGDNGTETANRYADILREAKTGFVKGPQGNYKNDNFKKSSEITFGALADSGAFWMTGGGDTDQLISDLKLQPSHRTLAGGAFLKFKSGKELPAISRLAESRKQQGVGETDGGDRAVLTSVASPGGIDFNPKNFDIQSEGKGMDIDFAFDPANFETMPVNGFIPVIFQISPISNFPSLLLGVSDQEEKQQLTQLKNYTNSIK